MRANIQTRASDEYGAIGFQNGRNYDSEKEMGGAISIVALYRGEMRECVTARFWRARSRNALTVYCSVWLAGLPDPETGGNRLYSSGTGTAGGGGYHKPSAALSDALGSAGVALNESISGRGERAMYGALGATARGLGFRGKILTVRHGSLA